MGDVTEVTKVVEFEDGTSYEVTHSGEVTETTSVYAQFFNALREDGFDVDDSNLEYCAYIDSNGGNIIGGHETTVEDIANEFGLTIDHVWFTHESDSSDNPIHLAVEKQDTCGVEMTDDTEPEQPFEYYLRENVFTNGSYCFVTVNGVTKVAEHDDGGGYLIFSDCERAKEDDNVTILDDPTDGGGHFNGQWLVLEDDR